MKIIKFWPQKIFHSNTTLVKVKFHSRHCNQVPYSNSNTTLVKVKFAKNKTAVQQQGNSNTTLVKVKCQNQVFLPYL